MLGMVVVVSTDRRVGPSGSLAGHRSSDEPHAAPHAGRSLWLAFTPAMRLVDTVARGAHEVICKGFVYKGAFIFFIRKRSFLLKSFRAPHPESGARTS